MKTTIQYLMHNDNDPATGLFFTCRDYDFLTANKLDKIWINSGKRKRGIELEEILTKEDIIERIKELYYIVTEMKIVKENVNLEMVRELIKSFD